MSMRYNVRQAGVATVVDKNAISLLWPETLALQ
jgi:hypothetical protein